MGNTASESYKKIYWFSWKCFQAADADRDGQVPLHDDDHISGFFKQAPLCAGVWRRVCDDDRDLDGEPEEARLAGSFPNPGGEGRLLQGR